MQLRNLISSILLLGLIWPSLSAASPISGDSILPIENAKAQQDNSDPENEDEERVEAKV